MLLVIISDVSRVFLAIPVDSVWIRRKLWYPKFDQALDFNIFKDLDNC